MYLKNRVFIIDRLKALCLEIKAKGQFKFLITLFCTGKLDVSQFSIIIKIIIISQCVT